MKLNITFFSLFFIPIFCWAGDHCTNPEEYTVDKRCYVTKEQRNTKPFNAVVEIYGADGIPNCTGTIVENNGKKYIYTAKHCTDSDKDGFSDKELKIKLQDDRTIFVNYENAGAFDTVADTNFWGDWAYYNIQEEDVPFVLISNYSGNNWIPVRVIGYGSLKIMSDKEIKDFKEQYKKYLTENKQKYNFDNGVYKNGVNIAVSEASSFISNFSLFKQFTMFMDISLKISECKVNPIGKVKDCQTWHGNSGGGLFDNDGNIIATVSRGLDMIGGKHHASKNLTEVLEVQKYVSYPYTNIQVSPGME